MLSDDLMALRLRQQDLRAQRALCKSTTQSWKERSRSVSSSDVLGDIERAFLLERGGPASALQRSFVQAPRSSTSSPNRSRSIAVCASSNVAAAVAIHASSATPAASSGARDSPMSRSPRVQSPHTQSPHLQSPLRSNPRSRFVTKAGDIPTLDASNPAAFFASSGNSSGRRAGSGVSSPRPPSSSSSSVTREGSPAVGSGRQDGSTLSTPRQAGSSSRGGEGSAVVRPSSGSGSRDVGGISSSGTAGTRVGNLVSGISSPGVGSGSAPRAADARLGCHHQASPAAGPAANRSRLASSLSRDSHAAYPLSSTVGILSQGGGHHCAHTLFPSSSTTGAADVELATTDNGTWPPLPTLGGEEASQWGTCHPSFADPGFRVPRTQSVGSLGLFGSFGALHVEVGPGLPGDAGEAAKPGEGGPAYGWCFDPLDREKQGRTGTSTGTPPANHALFQFPVGLNIPMLSPRPAGASSTSQTPTGGTMPSMRSPRLTSAGSSALVSQGLGVASPLSKALQSPTVPSGSYSSLLASGGQPVETARADLSASGAPTHGAAATSSRRLVRRSSYGGMDWWRVDSPSLAALTADVSGVGTCGRDEYASRCTGAPMAQVLTLEHCVGQGAGGMLGQDRHARGQFASGVLLPRHIFDEGHYEWSAGSSPRPFCVDSPTGSGQLSLEDTGSGGFPHSTSAFQGNRPLSKDRPGSAVLRASTPQAEGFASPLARIRNSSSTTSSSHCSPSRIAGRGRVASLQPHAAGGFVEAAGQGLPGPGGSAVGPPHAAGPEQPAYVRNLKRHGFRTSAPRSDTFAVPKTLSWNEERVLRTGGEEDNRGMPSTKQESDNLANPFTWKELEESCRKLDEANIRIAGIDLTDVASHESNEDCQDRTAAGDVTAASTCQRGAPADVGPDGDMGLLLSPATVATQKCTVPWLGMPEMPVKNPAEGTRTGDLPPRSPSSVSSPMSPAHSNSPGSPAETSSPKKVLINRVLGKVRKQWESLHGNSRFLSRHGSAHM